MSSIVCVPNATESSQPTIEDVSRLVTDTVFVNYTTPTHFKDKAHRKAAQAYLSRNYGRKHRRIVISRRDESQPKKVAENNVHLDSGLTLRNVTQRSPWEVLGSGRLDPFDVYCVQDPPLFVHQMLDHGESSSFLVPRCSLILKIYICGHLACQLPVSNADVCI